MVNTALLDVYKAGREQGDRSPVLPILGTKEIPSTTPTTACSMLRSGMRANNVFPYYVSMSIFLVCLKTIQTTKVLIPVDIKR